MCGHYSINRVPELGPTSVRHFCHILWICHKCLFRECPFNIRSIFTSSMCYAQNLICTYCKSSCRRYIQWLHVLYIPSEVTCVYILTRTLQVILSYMLNVQRHREMWSISEGMCTFSCVLSVCAAQKGFQCIPLLCVTKFYLCCFTMYSRCVTVLLEFRHLWGRFTSSQLYTALHCPGHIFVYISTVYRDLTVTVCHYWRP